MSEQSLDQVIDELRSEEWLERGYAIRKLSRLGDVAATALPELFNLTFDEKAPIVSDSSSLIKKLGQHAVGFLRDQARYGTDKARAQAIALLIECGFRWATTTRLIEQRLRSRRDELPVWGCDPDEMMALFVHSLNNPCLDVRFNAACALEEFGHHVADTIPVFIEALQSGTQHQQNWAALHLGRIGPTASAASEALQEATQSPCPYTALAASNALTLVETDITNE